MNQMVISVVIPLYYAQELIESLIESLEEFSSSYVDQFQLEIVFVDDGSTDRTFELMKQIEPSYFKFKLIRLSRNFKSYIAILAGINETTGDYITFLPQDLQEPPELVLELFNQLKLGYDVAWAVRRTREDPWLDRWSSEIFHQIMHWVWPLWPRTGADMFMITRPVANILLEMQEKNSHITGQILWSGFRQTRLFYDRRSRKIGKSGWSFWKKIELSLNVITQFSYLPIRACTTFGIILAVLGLLYAISIFINRLIGLIPVPGWSALMIVVLIVSGFQLIFLGVIGEYLWRIFDEVRKRPTYIIMEKFYPEEKHD